MKVTARKSTGSAPPPRRRRLNPDSDSEDDSDSGAAGQGGQDLASGEGNGLQSLLREADWEPLTGEPRGLTKDFELDCFSEAWAFMNRLALECERRQFFPKLTVQDTTVTVTLAYEGGGGEPGRINQKGFEFASFADSIATDLGII